MSFRVYALWAAIIPLAILNGIFRDAVLARLLPAALARTLSGVLLCGIILWYTTYAVRWMPARGALGYLGIGCLWLALTVAFEFIFGHFVAKKSLAQLLAPYTFKGGDIWVVVLLVVLFAPLAASLLRRS